MGKLFIPENPSRDRCTVDGRGLHCGDGLELLLPGGQWVPVRFEMSGAFNPKGRFEPVLYLGVGGDWERWTPPPGLKEGDQYEVTCDCCQGRKQLRKGDRCYSCDGRGTHTGMVIGDPEKVTKCRNCDGTGKVLADGECFECWRSKEEGSTGKRWRTVDAPGAPQVVLTGDALRQAELRWRGSAMTALTWGAYKYRTDQGWSVGVHSTLRVLYTQVVALEGNLAAAMRDAEAVARLLNAEGYR